MVRYGKHDSHRHLLLIVLGPVAHPHVQDGPQQNSLNQKATTGVKQWPLFMTPVLFFLFLHLSPTSSNVFFLYFCLYCSLLLVYCLIVLHRGDCPNATNNSLFCWLLSSCRWLTIMQNGGTCCSPMGQLGKHKISHGWNLSLQFFPTLSLAATSCSGEVIWSVKWYCSSNSIYTQQLWRGQR